MAELDNFQRYVMRDYYEQPKRRARKKRAAAKGVKRIGSRTMVMNGTAQQTSGGLKKKDLVRVHGKIVSRRKRQASGVIGKLKKNEFLNMHERDASGKPKRITIRQADIYGVKKYITSTKRQMYRAKADLGDGRSVMKIIRKDAFDAMPSKFTDRAS